LKTRFLIKRRPRHPLPFPILSFPRTLFWRGFIKILIVRAFSVRPMLISWDGRPNSVFPLQLGDNPFYLGIFPLTISNLGIDSRIGGTSRVFRYPPPLSHFCFARVTTAFLRARVLYRIGA